MKTNTLRSGSLILLLLVLIVISGRGAAGQGASATPQGGAATPTPTPARAPRRPRADRRVSNTPRPVKPRFVRVVIISNLPDCVVTIDNEIEEHRTDEQGRLMIPMEPGIYDVTVTKSGYVTDGRVIDVKAPPYQQEERFTLSRALFPLKVKTSPPGAKVSLDGKLQAESDAEGIVTFKVDPTVPHTLRASKEDYVAKDVTLPPRRLTETIILTRDLRPLTVWTNPPEAEVFLDGDLKGKSDAKGFLNIAKVKADMEHSVQVAKEGYVTKTETLRPNHEFIPVTLDAEGSAVSVATTASAIPTPVTIPAPTPTPAPSLAPTVDGSEVSRLVKEGRLARAIEAYALLASSEPQNLLLTVYLDELLQTMHERTSAALARVGPYGLAVPVEEARELSELYERVRKWRPGDQRLQALAEYWTAKYWQVGAQLIPSQGGREVYLQKARAAAKDAGAFNPRDARVLFDIGWLHRTLGDTDAAVRYFNEAHVLDSAWAYPLFALATIDMRAAEMEVAKAAKATRYERAVDNFTKAITINPAFLQAYELRCLAYAVINRHQEAVASGQQAVALKPTSAYAHYALGFAYYQFGLDKDKKQYRNAINEFNLALTLADDALDPPTLESVRQKLAAMKKSLGIKP